MAYGLTNEGFILKRAPEIKSDFDNKAIQLFQDLVEEGDVVDVSSSSLLGRLIGINSEPYTYVWEMLQEVYNAMDPNSATGAALDNLVAYGAITRQGASSSVASMLMFGSVGTTIPSGSVIRSTTTNTEYQTSASLTLSNIRASGIGISIGTVTPNTEYTITYQNGSFSVTVIYTSTNTPNQGEIIYGIKSVIDSSHPALTAEIIGTTLVVYKAEIFEFSDFSVSANIFIVKAANVVQAVAVNPGPTFNEANTIVQITTPVLGWDTARNPVVATRGSNTETDEELRIRFRNSKAVRATNIIESLYSSLYDIPEVSSVKVYENDTDVEDEYEVPPHSFKVVILGGDSQAIANAIWKNKPTGIKSSGTTIVTVLDSYNNPHDVAFVRPSPVPIYIDVVLDTFPDFPSDGIQSIKTALVQYFEDNFGVGKEIIYTRLYTPINSVQGHEVVSLNIGIDPSLMQNSNIAIDYDSIASLSTTNINIYT